jgi:hypothetical protein
MSAPAPGGLPPEIWPRVRAFVAGDRSQDPLEVAKALVGWLEGKPIGALDAVLDALRGCGAYPISVHVLRASWEAELPLDALGRIAEDWVGTILRGYGDRAGAHEVAEHLTPRALELGPSFAGDLGDLLMNYDLHDAARPLVALAAQLLPGDMSHRFNLGVLQKLDRDWAGARDSFAQVLQFSDDPATRWNLGLACTALKDWAGARSAWAALGLQLPPGEGDFAAPGGQYVPVRLRARQDAPVRGEVVWGERLCPARVRLHSLPRFASEAAFGDVVLVDGAATGEATNGEGRKVSVHDALAVFSRLGGQTYELRGPDGSADTAACVAALHAQGYAVVDWTGIGGLAGARVGIVLPPGRAPALLVAALDALSTGGLVCPELWAAAGLDPTAHRAALTDAELT